MSEPVDLKNLREMTDGDKEMEKSLFQEFFSSFEDGIKALKASLGDIAAETWRKNAHALKGISLNLGANKLGELCKSAQEKNTSPQDAKKSLLAEIEWEYAEVKKFLQGCM